MSVKDNILNAELKLLEKRYEHELEIFQCYIEGESKGRHLGITRVICKLLTSPFLILAAGSTDKHGYIYNNYIEDSRLRRLQLVSYFVNELVNGYAPFPKLDWHRYSFDSGKYEDAKPFSSKASPYWSTFAGEDLSFEKVLWTLNWYEEHEIKRKELYQKGSKPYDPPKKDELMIRFANELRDMLRV